MWRAAHRMQIGLSVVERMTLPVLVIVLTRFEGRVHAISHSDVGSQAGVFDFELVPQRLDLAVQVHVFFFELADAGDRRRERRDLFWRDGQGVLQPDHGLLELGDGAQVRCRVVRNARDVPARCTPSAWHGGAPGLLLCWRVCALRTPCTTRGVTGGCSPLRLRSGRSSGLWLDVACGSSEGDMLKSGRGVMGNVKR